MDTDSLQGPSAAVIDGFAIRDEPVRLSGGQGGTWRAGGVILKPVDFVPETNWRAEVLEALPESEDFRIARPVRAVDGTWIAEGWEASHVVDGVTDVRRQDEVLRAGIEFHRAIATFPRPDFLDLRDDPWSIGDRAAWGELPFQLDPAADVVAQPLSHALHPVDLPSQAVHGDLPGNVLFAAGLPPAIIDWPVYWRPPTWALAVAVVDALCWYDATPDLAERWAHLPAWGQMLIRALIYRIATDEAASGPACWTADRLNAYRPTVDLAVGIARRQTGR
ncbi:TIGR02569 family protein [Kribbella albertanoniae]|uniref:TIGR02569 family protein n=1 Tax=Kribbella albertanoniae TaxID=1266829 RepID=UPI001EDD5AD0|nr:TIGR02569 family protein [Kribbella albertanoniae]